MGPSSNFLYNNYEEGSTFRYISVSLSFTICWLNLLSLLYCIYRKKLIKHFGIILWYNNFTYCHYACPNYFWPNWSHWNCLLAHYDGAGPDEYLSNTDSYNDNDSNCGSDNYNNYESNYESDNEEAPCASTSITKTPLVQLPNVKKRKANVIYTLRQE